MRSCIFVGRVRHARTTPIEHRFEYGHVLFGLDLAELDQAFAKRWLWSNERANVLSFRRRDHLGDPDEPLHVAVRRLVRSELGREPHGSILLLTQPRLFGYAFNPVSFYFVRDEAGELDAIVAEINNTPWNEQHCYVLDAKAAGASPSRRFRFGKAFHVSPFMPMQLAYDWSFSEPSDELAIRMINLERGHGMFSAELLMRRRAWTGANVALALARLPLLSFQVVAAIYWQALRLRLKGAPFHAHPRARATAAELETR